MTFYCALGAFEKDHETQQPIIIRHGQPYGVIFEEFVLWSTLFWSINSYDEMQEAYENKMRQSGVQTCYDFDGVFQRLLLRGLIAQGAGDSGIDALYELLGNLFLVPVKTLIWDKLGAFFHMTFVKGIPFGITRHIFDNDLDILTQCERSVWNLTRQQILTTAELIRCAELNLQDVSSDAEIVQQLYGRGDDVNHSNVFIHARFSDKQQPVLEAAANLYLKKYVLFETAE